MHIFAFIGVDNVNESFNVLNLLFDSRLDAMALPLEVLSFRAYQEPLLVGSAQHLIVDSKYLLVATTGAILLVSESL